MKKFFYLAMMAFVALGITACGDDKNETPSGTNALKGTEWVYAESEDETEDGVTYTLNLTATLKFTTVSNGSLDIYMDVVVGGQSMYNTSDVQEFTYTYDGNGHGTMTNVDEEDGTTSTIPFTINGNELTISDIDEDTGETLQIVFTRK